MSSRRALAFLALGAAIGAAAVTALGSRSADVADGGAAWDYVNRTSHAVSHIAFRVEGGATPGQAQALAKLAYDKVMAGGDFAEVARAQSQEPSSEEGGFLGWVRAAGEESAFAGAVMALRPGEISMPVLTRRGWQIIKRHTFEEAVALEKRYRIPTHGFFVPWAGLPGAATADTREEARARAEKARAEIEAGTLTLEEAHERFTPRERRSPTAFIGMTAKAGQQRVIHEALERAKEGELIGPLSTAYGWGVLRRGRYMRALLKQILVQHALVKDRELSISRAPAEARAVAEQALTEARADPTRWDELVVRYSDDKGSAANSGAMGVLHAGEMPPGFETFIHELAPGQIYDRVVETPLGFHVVWRVR